jgi:Zn-dependent metalloprotease
MDTASLRTRNMSSSTVGSGSSVVGPLSLIGDAAINDAHAFSEITLDMLRDWQGYDSFDDNGAVIHNRVHYGSGVPLPFWDGTFFNYGDGNASFYAGSGSLDVVAHEVGHAFVSPLVGLSGDPQDAIEESFADIVGETAEAYYEGAAPDFLVGPDITRSLPAKRYLCTPTADGVSIDHLSGYAPGVLNGPAGGPASRVTGYNSI